MFFIKSNKKTQLTKIFTAGLFMGIGLVVFKMLPMQIWGENILFDASMHLTLTFFVLYLIWFFVDQNKGWIIPYFIFGALVLFVIALQRIVDNAHNDIGLLIGLIISLVSICIAERKKLKNKFVF